MVIIARDHYRNRRLDLALYALQAILDGFEPVSENPPRDKDNAEALLLRGLIYREQGSRAAALEEFRKAVERRPDLVEARVQLATFLLEAGNAAGGAAAARGRRAVRLRATSPRTSTSATRTACSSATPTPSASSTGCSRATRTCAQVHYDLGLLYLFAPDRPRR